MHRIGFQSKWPSLALLIMGLILPQLAFTQGPNEHNNGPSADAAGAPAGVPSAQDLGISFVEGSSSQVVIEREGRQYMVDLSTHAIREVDSSQPGATVRSSSNSSEPALSSSVKAAAAPPIGVAPQTAAAPPTGAAPQQSSTKSAPAADNKSARTYDPGDDLIYSLPTGRRLERHGFYINFTHRFPYEPAFTGPGRGDTLFGLDNFSVSSFGFRFGVTSKLSVMAYRSPSIIGRPIELMAAYNFLDESDHQPFNLAVRFSVDGQNNFSSNFTENFEIGVSRSLGRRAQLYAVPTFSINNRPLLQNMGPTLATHVPTQTCSLPLAVGIPPSFNVRPCANTFSLGVGAAVDIRPTVALVAETIPTLVNGTDLGIHRAPFSFGVKKKIWRHAFTLGFGNSPGTIVSNRAGTNATFQQQPGADKPSQIFIGFDLTRQTH